MQYQQQRRAGHTTVPARDAQQRGCIGRHLTNRNGARFRVQQLRVAVLVLANLRRMAILECIICAIRLQLC